MEFAKELSEMNLAQLRELSGQVAQQIVKTERKAIDDAVNTILRVAHDMNMPLKMLLERGGLLKELTSKGAPKVATPRAPVSVQYIHPIDKSLTWTGRGRQPAWVKQLTGEGGKYTLEQLRVPR